MKPWFMSRGYPEDLIDSKIGKVVLSKEKRLRNKRVKGIPLGIPLVFNTIHC